MADETAKSDAAENGSLGEVGGFRVLKYLGGGGMGKVFLAEDLKDGRKVALKTIRSVYHGDAHLLRRFYKEAHTAATLRHPNIVPVEKVFRVVGVPYMVMPFIEGGTLGQLLYHQKRMPWQQALKVIGQIASALAYAHQANVIHRDVKPDNIFIDRSGRARILDFGLAKLTTSTSNLTLPGMVIGTPAYMSPEQCTGKEATPASDVYALGVVLYEALGGKRPFESDNPIALTQKIIVEQPAPLDDLVADLPEDVLWLVHNMMHKDPKQRLPASSLCDIIADVLLGKPRHSSTDMAEAMSALRAELLADPTKEKLGSNLDTPSALDGVDLTRRTPSRMSTLRPKVPGPSRAKRILLRMAALLLLAVASGAGTYLWFQMQHAGTDLSALASVVQSSSFQNVSPEVVTFRVNDSTLRYRPLGWDAQSQHLWLFARDTASNAATQLQGIAMADLEGKEVYRLQYGSVDRGIGIPFASGQAAGSRFRQGIFHFTSRANPTGTGKHRELVFQPTDRLADEVCFRADPTPAHAHDDSFHRSTLHDAVLHPDGKTFALVLMDQKTKRKGLYERREDDSPLNSVTGPFFEIQGEVRLFGYAPSGGQVAFRANFQDGKLRRNEVFAIRTDEPGAPMMPLGPSSAQGTEAAYHPKNDLLLVCHLGDDQAYALYVVRTDRPDAVRKPLGGGRIGKAPWHPSGDYFVATAPDGKGQAQLFAVYPERGTRMQLTGPGNPLGDISEVNAGDTPVVSPDGSRLAVRVRSGAIACASLDAVPHGT